MSKCFRLCCFLMLLLCICTVTVWAQADYKSEAEFKKQAAKLFEEEEYVKAYPLYTQLVSLYKKDPDYNYRLGVCMLYAIDNKEQAIPYLEFALRTPKEIDKEAYFYLAKAYHLNYRFDDAIGQYKAYKKIASAAKAERLQVDRQIEMCYNGKRLLQTITDLQVIQKVEMNREDFFRNYDISDIGGKLLVKPDEKEFKTALDKKKKENTIIYLAPNGKQIYFSSYGDNERNGKDIYVIQKKSNGEWEKAQALSRAINTPYDEDFPFLHPNGNVLYFCSKGHNSMGGYDVFKSTYNEETKEWQAPVNLDFPINTPDDDILYLTDKDDKKAYFSSARASVAEKIAVYHINVEPRAVDFAMIKGTVIKNHQNQDLGVKITIKNIGENNLIVGMFSSSRDNGKYTIKLPNGGRFLFTVEAPGFTTQSDVVEIPPQTEFRALRQEIIYNDTTDKLTIKNFFGESSDTSYLLAIDLIKEKAKMDVSSSSSDFASNDTDNTPELASTALLNAANNTSSNKPNSDTTSTASTQTNNTTPTAELSNEDIVRIAYKDAKETENEAKELRAQADISLNFANQKNELAQSKQQAANKLMAEAAQEKDNVRKQELTEQANAANREAQQLNEETVAAFNIAKRIDATAASKQQEAELSQQYAKELELAVKSTNSREATAKLDLLERKLDSLSQANASSLPLVNSFKKDEDNKKRELDKAVEDTGYMKQDISDNETIIAGLQAEAAKEKNSKIKEALLNQVEELKQENIDKQKQIVDNEVKVAKLQKEYNALKSETALVSGVVEQSKTEDSQIAASKAATVDKAKLEQQVNTIKATTTTETSAATIASNTTNTTTTANGSTTPDNTDNTTNTPTVTTTETTATKQQTYTNETANTQIAQADLLDKEANDLLAEATRLKTESTENISKSEQKDRKRQSEDLAKQAQAKKEQSAQLYANANKTEYTTNQTQLEQVAKNNANSTSPDLFKAELLSDESKKFFEEAKADRERAAKAKTPDEKEAALEAAKGNELVAIEKQREALDIYNNYVPTATTATNTVAQNNNATNTTPDNSNNTTTTATNNTTTTQPTTTTTTTSAQTTEATMDGINSKYEAELAATESIQNPADKEKAKAVVLRNWSEAIDADIEKQKQDYATTTDPAIKAQIAKRMESAETNSKQKQEQATQSRKNAETLKQQELASVTNTTQPERTTTPTTNTNTNATTTTATKTEPVVKSTTPDNAVANNTTTTPTNNQTNTTPTVNTSQTDNTEEPQYQYSSPVASQQIEKANILNDEADDLLAQAILPQLETSKKQSEAERKRDKENAEKMIAQAQQKKTESEQLFAQANTTEYNARQNELNNKATTSNSTNPDVQQANKLKDEAKQQFDIAVEERKTAEKTTNAAQKDMILEDARENELAALRKQKEALDLYKKAEQSKTTTVLASNTTTPVTKTTNPAEPNNTTKNTTPANNSEQKYTYSSQKAMEQSIKASTLNKQAEDIMTQSLDMKTQAIAQSNTDAKNSMYAQSEELMKDAHAKKGEAAQLAATANSDEYKNNQKQLQQYTKNAPKNNSPELFKAELLNEEAEGYFSKAKTQRQEAAATDSYYAKEAIYEDAAANELIALNKQKQAMDIYKNYTPTSVASTKTTTTTTPTNATALSLATTSKANVNQEVVLAPNESFEQRSTPTYSSKNPIPIDSKMPEGLIFKVQVGAFRKPIPQNLFKGISPITGETTPKGFIRYTAGIFTKYSNADKVKNKIVAMGYKDAFVVAFLNGKRIPINEAYALAEGTPSTVLQVNAATNKQQPTNTTVQNTTPVAVTTTTTQDNPNEIIKSKEVSDIGGLFYTVQVGVFSQPVPASRLYSMSPLFNEKTANGSIRYYTGIYKSVSRANEAKEIVVDIGVKDAFVTAYYNGKRISVAEAKNYEAQGATFPASPDANKLPNFRGTTRGATPPRNPNATTEQPADNVTKQQLANVSQPSNTVHTDANLIYKVQIGAFYEEVPLDMANKFLKIAKKGIQTNKESSGLTIYTVGNLTSYGDANALKDEVIAQAGLTDAFIVAYRNGEKIPVDEAKQSGK